MSSKSILIISSYAASKLARFLRHSVYAAEIKHYVKCMMLWPNLVYLSKCWLLSSI